MTFRSADMPMNPIYLDHAASTPVRAEVREAMLPLLSQRFGNPSSVHRWGREARAQLENARARVAAVLGAAASEIVFTRGGTEADNLAVLGRARAARGAVLACSAIEHKAVLASAAAATVEGARLHLLPVTPSGVVETDGLDAVLAETPGLVSVMWVNNEVGTVQPVEELARRCQEAGVPFHSDAVQAFGKVPVRVDQVPVALLSLSAHKVYGPKGTGVLFVRRGTRLEPLIHGGGHERGVRSGTEDVAGAVGMAAAMELAEGEREAEMRRQGALRDRLEGVLRDRVPGLVVHGAGVERVASILNVSVPGASTETLLLTLDMEGIAVSSGSACSSGAVTASHVLGAMGVAPEVAGPSIRFSLGRDTTEAEIDRVAEALPPLLQRLRALADA